MLEVGLKIEAYSQNCQIYYAIQNLQLKLKRVTKIRSSEMVAEYFIIKK